jgi:hypothetical protein
MYFANGNKYEGMYKNDKYYGRGVYVWTNGSIYDGEWIDGERCGHGTITYESGDKYDGQYRNDKFNGQGTYTWADGCKYVGEWKDGEQSGYGVYTWTNGNRFEGEWANGKREGEGKIIYASGGYYKGFWENDKLLQDDDVSIGYSVVLTDIGSNKMNVVKTVKESCGLALMDAKKLVDACPSVIIQNTSKDNAERILSELKKAGATAQIKK